MARTYFPMLGLSILGLLFSAFKSRPDFSNIEGWMFSVLWCSLAWCLLVWVAALSFRFNLFLATIGGFLALAGSEFLLFSYVQDPLLFAVKPMYQLPIGAMGILIGLFCRRWQ